MILVKFVCKARSCGNLLATIEEPLPDNVLNSPRENVTYTVRKCRQHGFTFDGFDRLAKQGKTVTIGFGPLLIPPDVLWGLIDTAWRTTKTQTYRV